MNAKEKAGLDLAVAVMASVYAGAIHSGHEMAVRARLVLAENSSNDVVKAEARWERRN